jgi:protein TonB
MNSVEEQKSLVDQLEALLQEAIKKSPLDPVYVERIVLELKDARAEHERLLSTSSALAPMLQSAPAPTLPPRSTAEAGVPVETELHSTAQAAVSAEPELKLTLDLKWEPRYRTLLNNLKSLFTHETKVYRISANPIQTNLLVEPIPWYKTISSNLKSLFRPEKKSYNITAKPISTDLLMEHRPWYLDLITQLKYLFVKEEKPAIEVTAQPVEVGEVFRDYKFRSSSVGISVLVHVVMIAAMLFLPMLFLGNRKVKSNETKISLLDPSALLLNLPKAAEKSGGGGGGGRREPIPASRGKLPRPADRQLTPPVPKVVNPDPVLPVEPTVVVPQLAQLPTVNLPDYGDPTSIPGPPSSGPGTGGGIGTGTGGGVGPGKGGGVGPGEGGGIGGGIFRVGGGVSAPTIIFRVEPTYSEEARKAKYQGVVVLSAIVRKDGTIEILKVVRGLGLGLDENAIQALKQWKFRPGMRNGIPVDVALNIEVNFSLR